MKAIVTSCVGALVIGFAFGFITGRQSYSNSGTSPSVSIEGGFGDVTFMQAQSAGKEDLILEDGTYLPTVVCRLKLSKAGKLTVSSMSDIERLLTTGSHLRHERTGASADSSQDDRTLVLYTPNFERLVYIDYLPKEGAVEFDELVNVSPGYWYGLNENDMLVGIVNGRFFRRMELSASGKKILDELAKSSSDSP